MKTSNIELNDNDRVRFLISIVKEKLISENIKFAKVLVSNWDQLIDDDMLSKLSLSRNDLKSDVEIDGNLKELVDKYIEENPEDSQRLISGMNQFAGEGLNITITIAIFIVIETIILGGNFHYKVDEDGKMTKEVGYEQSQATQEKILETLKEVAPKR